MPRGLTLLCFEEILGEGRTILCTAQGIHKTHFSSLETDRHFGIVVPTEPLKSNSQVLVQVGPLAAPEAGSNICIRAGT